MTAHWTERWIGVRAPDCAAYAERVLREEFGARVSLPSRADSQRGRDAQIAAAASMFRRAAVPRDGDVALLGRVGRRRGVGAHVGVCAVVDGEPRVLHLRAGGAGELHDAAALRRCGLAVEEWWRVA